MLRQSNCWSGPPFHHCCPGFWCRNCLQTLNIYSSGDITKIFASQNLAVSTTMLLTKTTWNELTFCIIIYLMLFNSWRQIKALAVRLPKTKYISFGCRFLLCKNWTNGCEGWGQLSWHYFQWWQIDSRYREIITCMLYIKVN